MGGWDSPTLDPKSGTYVHLLWSINTCLSLVVFHRGKGFNCFSNTWEKSITHQRRDWCILEIKEEDRARAPHSYFKPFSNYSGFITEISSDFLFNFCVTHKTMPLMILWFMAWIYKGKQIWGAWNQVKHPSLEHHRGVPRCGCRRQFGTPYQEKWMVSNSQMINSF